MAATVTDFAVNPPLEIESSRWRRLGRRPEPTNRSGDPRAQGQAEEVLETYGRCLAALGAGVGRLATLDRPRLVGKVEDDQRRVTRAAGHLRDAQAALGHGDFAQCGKAVRDVHRELSSVGGLLTAAINNEFTQAAVSRQQRVVLQANVDKRKEAQAAAAGAERGSVRAGLLASASLFEVMAEGFNLAAETLGHHVPPVSTRKPASSDADIRVVAPHELETFADVGGLKEPIGHVQRTIGAALQRGGPASGLVHNGILLHGPPGTGKTLLARAVAGEYGLRFIRFSPAAIASAYQHEPARKLRQVFDKAAESAPCLLFLDEVDAIAGRREGSTSADQRELVTQLLNSLEEYRGTPGLVIMAATNTIDELDPALREGRFDSRIAVPLPDADARVDILAVRLGGQDVDVDWDGVDLEAIAQSNAGRSGAFLTGVVNGAAQRAVSHGGPLTQADLVAEMESRSGQDRPQTIQERVGWDDVVLPPAVRQRLQEILLVFQRPDLGRQLGVRPPAGILLYGPPGTGKTTIARAMASEVKASFYEQSAADLLSKWVGESEQQIRQLFTRARANRPSIIFCDEIDALLKRRMPDSSTPWEERVVSQFLQELDGLQSGEGVLLVGSTNRPDMIDDAIRERRLVSIEVPLPDRDGRQRLLEVLWRDVRLAPDVDLDKVADATDAMSGADLKALRDSAGMKALVRAALGTAVNGSEAAVERKDLAAALAERGRQLGPARRSPATGGRARKQTPATPKSPAPPSAGFDTTAPRRPSSSRRPANGVGSG